MKTTFILFLAIVFLLPLSLISQKESSNTKKSTFLDTLTYQTQSGLPVAASKIYFSDSKFTVSGFGEASYIHYNGAKDRASGDIELYMTNLYRLVGYLGWKPQPWLVLYAEIFAEFLQDRDIEFHPEYFFEFFADFMIHERFNVRIGTHQVQIGYLNNNDEPILYYSVNRPDVERIIIPSTWIDLGIMTYGKLAGDFKYSLSAYQGLDTRSLNGGTWLRRGRDDELRFNFNGWLLNSQLIYDGFKNTEMSVSGLFTRVGNNETIPSVGIDKVAGKTWLLTSYLRHEYNDLTIMALGSIGGMGDTDQIFQLTSLANDQLGQVLGSQVYGYYLEVGYDVLPWFRKSGNKSESNGFLIRKDEMKLPVFFRYERLNTHAAVHPGLIDEFRSQTDLKAWTLGVNFNPRKSIVFKANYQLRNNTQPLSNGEMEGNRMEVGVGFIF